MTFSRLFFLTACTYAVYHMNHEALGKDETQIPTNENPGQDFDLGEDETGDLDFLRGLYPELTSNQLLEVKERLDGYFDVALETLLEKQKQTAVDD